MSQQAPREGSVRLVGTAHVSSKSVQEVEDAIREERPDVVAVELDEGRYRQLRGGTPDDIEPGDLLRGNTVFQFIAYWMLSYVQTRLGEKFDVSPGADMLAAVDTAEELGVDVALVDRDIQTTMQRFWSRMTALEKLRMVGGLLFGVSDPPVVGLVAGIFIGLLLGPAIGLFGGSVGITLPLLTSVAGGVLIGIVAEFVLYRLAAGFADGLDALAIGLGGGLAVGLVGGVGLGLADGVVTRYLGEFTIRVLGSMGLGLTAGVVLGGLVGLAIEAFGVLDAEDVEELDLEDLTDSDVVSVMMEEFREFSPGGAEALIDERDAYIASNLVGLRQQGLDVVAVIGAGHREGIERHLADPASLPPMESLTGTTSSGGIPWMKLVGVLISAGFVGFFVLLAMAGVRDTFLLQLFAAWFVVNGLFAATLAKLAGARWASALVGGAVAWMTSVNPLLAPGWFTGYMELRHTAVNVSDIGQLNELLGDEERPLGDVVSDMFQVPLFRLIMVVAATNVGSMVASVLFAAYLLPLFASDLGGVDEVSRLMVQGAARSADIIWSVFTVVGGSLA
mgnify:CR=1 FL=1